MEPDEPAGGPPEPEPGEAWRLTFAYRGDRVELVSRERLRMLAPPPDEIEHPASFRVEVRDNADSVVYSRAIRDPIARELEVFSPDPAEPIRWVRVPRPAGAFQVVVPALPAAHDLVLRGGQPPTEPMAPPAARGREVVRVPLRDEPSPVEREPGARGKRQ